MVKTTVDLPEQLWKDFSIKVIREYGGRANTHVFAALADAFVNHPNKTAKQAVDDWLKEKDRREAKALEEKE